MYNIINEIKHLANAYGFRFVPAAGVDWGGNWDHGKQPLTSIHEATDDESQLDAWAAKYAPCNWLFVPGSGQAVLDVDPRHGGDALLREIEEKHGALPLTVKSRTGGGGSHFLFVCDSSLSLKANLCGNDGLTFACGSKLGIVIPPCPHKSGNCYAWEVSPDMMRPAEAPAWLVELAKANAPCGCSAATRGNDAQGDPLSFVVVGGSTLADHPGEREGGRNRTLCSLIGGELVRGRSGEELEPEVVAWASRCSPPMPQADALRCLGSLWRKQQNTPGLPVVKEVKEADAEASAGASDLPSPSLTSFTGDGSDWLRHGLMGQFAAAVAPQLEGMVEPVCLCLLSCFGSAVGPHPFVRVGADRHRANLFACLVAGSGIGKSEPWAICSSLMERADPDWHSQSVAHGLGSGEGLIELASKEPRCFALESEFGGALTKARRDGSILTPTLCNAWDGRTLEVNNRSGNSLRAEGHHVSVWGNITDAELTARLSKGLEAVNGFGNRFLWLRQQRQRHLPFGGDLRCLESFAVPLRAALARAKATGEVRWSDEARPIWAQAYPLLCAAQDASPLLGRARSQALRLTLLFALLDGSDTIRPEHVRAGLSAWAWCEESARSIFGGEPPTPKMPSDPLSFTVGTPKASGGGCEQPMPHAAAKALARIAAKPGILRSDLLRLTKLKADELSAGLAWLQANSKAHSEASATGGRKGECWFLGAGQHTNPTAEAPGAGREVSEGSCPTAKAAGSLFTFPGAVSEVREESQPCEPGGVAVNSADFLHLLSPVPPASEPVNEAKASVPVFVEYSPEELAARTESVCLLLGLKRPKELAWASAYVKAQAERQKRDEERLSGQVSNEEFREWLLAM